ncbi:carbohydrate ABC transporter permease [Jiangella asiatica]|uniref:carbohydrate ABC transporter permease n=1 Tax=Jiangella asiatica TaxID=2530372 RepID=UPI00193D26E7|nr:carbohydrate ABC transporter permease [Jiangella asiatica]
MIVALLVIGGLVCLAPFFWLLRSSFMDEAQIFATPPMWIPDPFTIENYVDGLRSQPFFGYFLNTMTLELIVVPGILFTCSLAAFAFGRLRWRGRDVVFGVLMSGLMLPYAATLVPTFIGWERLGLIDTYVPLTLPAWFAGAGGGMASVFLLRQFFRTIPRDLDEAAYLDGASPMRVYLQIIVPLSKPALLVVGVFTFFAVWNDFLNPLVYISDGAKFTLALGLAAFKGTFSSEWGYLMAASTVVTLPVTVLFFVAQRQLLAGIALTGLKD